MNIIEEMNTARDYINRNFYSFNRRLNTEDYDTVVQELSEYLSSPDVSQISERFGSVTIAEELMKFPSLNMALLVELIQQ